MIEVEVLGTELAPGAPSLAEVHSLCSRAAFAAGVADGHVAVEFVDAGRIAALNREYRGHTGSTDVLSFPIDGVEPLGSAAAPPQAGDGQREASVERELGDIVICPEHTVDLREAIVHGMLHLLGMDHETDEGEMLALQDRLLARDRP
jgi:probable rRNA maturation factor